ncbi:MULTISPECIES: pyrroline-5-carboxylate reductase [Limnochorda]|uniref:pyrroline-5-carboxylate reductase n=1 Tax=Limnochorda TaxID=1676651 RepID=UPI00180B8225|nr:pyrroline-5-carboxylate reductase [Limnochorda pilosa]MBO2486651.1 pyrroline-5-carboxylate reductase [Bacillota bacterium]MBO2520054.1 pyrroline-5-carboxylate reductase [Bacillota bacterium]NMA71360.1 pyrroline-5-carboxylate reductase [Bacillota bacterium]
MLERRVSLIGAGAMGEALVRSLVTRRLVEPQALMAADVRRSRLEEVARRYGVRAGASNEEAARFGEVLILAVKPQQIEGVLQEIRPHLTPHHLILSIAAGVRIRFLESHLGDGVPVVRAMPNVACLVGEAASGFSLGRWAGEKEAELARQILGAVGQVFLLPEPLLDVVTGLSGSGPAFLALVIEALAEGGVACGLPREVAVKLAAQTCVGAGRLVLEGGLHPALLREMVTSPGGTSAAGIQVLEEGAVRAALAGAVRAATRRSQELSAGGREEEPANGEAKEGE